MPDGPDEQSPADGQSGIDTPPPFWGRWSKLYWLVGGLLAADVVVAWWLTRWAT
jgi:hypothetical protein